MISYLHDNKYKYKSIPMPEQSRDAITCRVKYTNGTIPAHTANKGILFFDQVYSKYIEHTQLTVNIALIACMIKIRKESYGDKCSLQGLLLVRTNGREQENGS